MFAKKKSKKYLSLLLCGVFVSSSLLFLTSCTIQSNNNANIGDNQNPKPPSLPDNGENNTPITPPNGNDGVNPPNNQNPETKPEDDIKPTLPSIEFEKRSGNGNVRTKYSTSSYIVNRYERKKAETYSNDELKEMWGEDKFSINDFPYPDNPIKLNFDKNRYKRIIDMYGSSVESKNTNKNPMMHFSTINELLENNKLKKHPIADYQYGKDYRVTEDTKAVEKVFNIDINEQGYISTGLFLPPGEIIEVSLEVDENEIAKNDDSYYFWLSLGKNESSDVNYVSLNEDQNQPNYPKLWPYRMPSLRASKTIDKKVFKFGSPFGGIVHLYNFTKVSEKVKNNIKISIKGAVEAINYVHGKTTEEEWNDQVRRYKDKNSENKITAPIFDISTDNIKFYGATKELLLENYDFRNMYSQKSYPQKAMDWWNYNALSSFDAIKEPNKRKNAILMTYTNFVPKGLAVAFPGNDVCILPINVAKDILNYDKLIDTPDVWINLHEFNHHNQSNGKWAFGPWVESSNNVLSLLSLLENSNFYSDRSDLSEKDNINNGHKFKILSSNQIKQNVNLGDLWTNSSKSREGTDTDFSIVISQFGPEMFRKYIKSFFDERYAIDYLGNKFEIPENLLASSISKNIHVIYRISIITGYDWSEYSEFTKLLTNSEKELIKSELNKKYSNIKKMMPVGSFYASKIKYGNDKKDWVKSSTPFYLKDVYNDYVFQKDLLVNVPTKNNTTTFSKIDNFKITEEPKFGTLLEENGNYKYRMKSDNDVLINNVDSFSYSFDVKDDKNNINKVEFKIDIQLSKYAGFKLEKNEDRIEENIIGPYSTKLGINGNWEIVEGKLEKNINVGRFNGQTIKSKDENSQIGFNFKGDSFDIYGFSSENHGEYDVYIDGKLITSSNNVFYRNSKKIVNTLDIQKLSSHKLNENKVYNVIVKPRTNKPIELSHFEFNGELLDINIKK